MAANQDNNVVGTSTAAMAAGIRTAQQLRAQQVTSGPVGLDLCAELIDVNGEFTSSGAVGPAGTSDGAGAALQLWGGVTELQVKSFLGAVGMHKQRARELVFTTVATLAAWLAAGGFLEGAWVGPSCPQKGKSIRRLKSFKHVAASKVRWLLQSFPCQLFIAAVQIGTRLVIAHSIACT